MASTTISGLSSGIDWQSTIDLIMQVESQPVTRLQERKLAYQQKNAAWNALQTKLTTLQASSQKIDTDTELLKKTASSSDTDVFTATAEAGAISGSHSIIVNQLAQAEIYVHADGWADVNSTEIYSGAGGQFAFNYDGDTIILDVPSGSTLLDLVQIINNSEDNQDADGNALVIASTIDDGGATDPIHLVLTAADPASANSFSIDDANTNLGTGSEFDDASWTRTQDAQESEIRVDGFPPSSWITRESNNVDDVLEGVTLTLKDTSATGVKVSVADNYTAIKSRIADWVSAYNDVMAEIKKDISYDAETETRGILLDDSQVRVVRSRLTDVVINEIPGLVSTATYKSLGDIGIDIGNNGTLTIDESELQDALEEDAEAVANLFAKSTSSTTSSLELLAYTEESEGGSYEVEVSWLSSGSIDKTASNTIGGYAATVENETVLVGKAGTEVEGIRIQFTYPGGGAGSTTGTIRFGAGVGVQVDGKVEVLTDSIDGLITNVTDSYQSQIDSLNDSIDSYEIRLEQKRESLVRQFLAMETAVSQARSQSSWAGAV
ncbi:flagellar filament capping protein FliD [bacterium]|nr:flagellar filament capping protein FliD [bacterium]